MRKLRRGSGGTAALSGPLGKEAGGRGRDRCSVWGGEFSRQADNNNLSHAMKK